MIELALMHRVQRGPELASKDEVEVVFRSFELDPQHPKGETEPVVEVLAKKYGMSEAQARQAEQHFAETARAAGLDFLDKDRDRGNTFAIHRLLHFAKTKGLQDELMKSDFQGPLRRGALGIRPRAAARTGRRSRTGPGRC